MSGFKNSELNEIYYNDLINKIVDSVLTCCENMLDDLIRVNRKIPNHEEKIRTHLCENYLNNDEVRIRIGLDKVPVRFIIESPVNYNSEEDTHRGRVDIKVVGENWLFRNINDYFTIECKRIDGSQELNRKFIDCGVCRFAAEPILYPSYNKKNFMFGFLVKDIDVNSNINLINDIQNETPCLTVNQEFIQTECTINNSYIYISKYALKENTLELKHLFYNFSQIVV